VSRAIQLRNEGAGPKLSLGRRQCRASRRWLPLGLLALTAISSRSAHRPALARAAAIRGTADSGLRPGGLAALATASLPIELAVPTPTGHPAAEIDAHGAVIGGRASTQPGFLALQSYHDRLNNRWTEIVEWNNLADAHAAMERIQRDPSLAGVMAFIAPESLVVGHHERLI